MDKQDVLKAVNVEIKHIAGLGAILLQMGPSTLFPDPNLTYFFDRTGSVTSDIDQAMFFETSTEAMEHVEVFRTIMYAFILNWKNRVQGNATVQSDLEVTPNVKYILVFTPPEEGHPDEYYNTGFVDQGQSTSIFEMATKFDTPQEAAAAKSAFRAVFKEGFGRRVSIRPFIEGITKPRQHVTPTSVNEAAMALGVPANPNPAPSKKPYYVIRFIDTSRENDTDGEITSPNWVRYYCEADVALYMEAAEVFDEITNATKTFNILRESYTENGALLLATESIMLKMRLLADIEQDVDLGAVKLFFNPKMIIQVLSVVETETGELKWEVVVQDDYQWVYPAPTATNDDEDDEDEA